MPADEITPPDDETPESPEDFDGDEDGLTGEEEKPAVFVTTREPIALTVTQVDDPRAPDSSALAAYIDGRLVARSAMPPEAIARLVGLKLFEEPVALGLFAYEEAPGLQCRLFALVPRAALEADAHASEPWKASVPSYEAMRDADHDDDDDGDDEGDEDGDPTKPSCWVTLCASPKTGSTRTTWRKKRWTFCSGLFMAPSHWKMPTRKPLMTSWGRCSLYCAP